MTSSVGALTLQLQTGVVCLHCTPIMLRLLLSMILYYGRFMLFRVVSGCFGLFRVVSSNGRLVRCCVRRIFWRRLLARRFLWILLNSLRFFRLFIDDQSVRKWLTKQKRNAEKSTRSHLFKFMLNQFIPKKKQVTKNMAAFHFFFVVVAVVVS